MNWPTPKACFACDRPARYAPAEGVGVCEDCARCVAIVARSATDRDSSDVWSFVPSPNFAPKSVTASRFEHDAEEVLVEFKRGVERTISPNDAQSHLDLAIAYAEMGLHGDALREAAIAALATSTTEGTMDASLKLMLTAPLIHGGGLKALRRRIAARRSMN